MSDEKPEKIVITSSDVSSKKVDEALSQQMSFGMPTAAPEKDRSAWYYKSWFVLMLAGAVGGCLAWAIMEPFFGDHIKIVGNIESIDAQAELPEATGETAKLTVSGNSIVLLKSVCRMDKGDGKWVPVIPGSFEKGQVVEVRGDVYSGPNPFLVAVRIRLRPGDTATYPYVSLQSLSWRHSIMGILVFPAVAGLVGLMIGGADGFISRAYGRGFMCALVGLAMGLVVGVVAAVAAELVYGILGGIVQSVNTGNGTKMSAGAYIIQVMRRGMAWALAGVAMGMGQGIALRSKKLFLNGLIGGVVGALLGGLLFDPINYIIGGDDAASSRAVGFTVIGLVTGLMVGIVELIAREAWLKMLAGPLAGKEFVLYKDPTSIGSSPKREVYLFKDPDVEPVHALIHRVGEGYEIEDQKAPAGVLVNGRKVSRQRLKTQDQIRIGSTVLLFTMKED